MLGLYPKAASLAQTGRTAETELLPADDGIRRACFAADSARD